MTDPTPTTDPYADLAAGFLDHYSSTRGVVRHTLIARQIRDHLPSGTSRVADIGGGAGAQAIELARQGCAVDLLDPSAEMLDEARAKLDQEPDDVAARVQLFEATGDQATAVLEPGGYDVAMCHGVLMYLDRSEPVVDELVQLVRPGGLVSVVTKNQHSLAMRAGLRGDWTKALGLFDADRTVGNLGAVTRGDTIEELTATLEASGAPVEAWYGIRVFTDHLPDEPAADDLSELIAAEWEAGRRDPYRGVAPLLHVLARRRPGTSGLLADQPT